VLQSAFPASSSRRARRRVVDAGHFECCGLEIACIWLRRLLVDREEELRPTASLVLVT
jgi:hypothetical protein